MGTKNFKQNIYLSETIFEVLIYKYWGGTGLFVSWP